MGPRVARDGCGKPRPPPGFDPLTVQHVASRYTDYSIPVHLIRYYVTPAVDLVRVVTAATSPEVLLIRIVSTRIKIWLSRIGVLISTHSGSFTESLYTEVSLSLSLSMSIRVFYNFLITQKFDLYVLSTYDQLFLSSNVSPTFLLLLAL